MAQLDAHLAAGPQMLEYESIARRIAGDRPGRVLDWGAGFGQMTKLLRDLGVEVTPFDYQHDIAADGLYPMQRYPELSVYISSDPLDLPYRDDEFDAALSSGVLEHVMDPERSLAELRRVLRPGGLLYVYKLPNRFSYLEWIARRAGMYHHGLEPYDRLYDLRRARSLLEGAGFEIAELRRANMLPLRLTRVPRLAPAIWSVNRVLSRVPGLSVLATNVELVARVP